MEKTVVACLDDIPLLQIQRWVFFYILMLHPIFDGFLDLQISQHEFISAYDSQGLSGVQAIWANQKYHSHRILPPDFVAKVQQSVLE